MAEQNDEPQDRPGQGNPESPNPTSLAIQEQANLVAKYASKLLSDDRAQEFATRVSLLARSDARIAKGILESPGSFLTAMMACVHLDLMPNTPQQHAFIIPYKNGNTDKMELQFQPGYKGLKELAYRSGEIKSLQGELVFDEDTFDVDYGTERKLVHKPNFDIDRTDFSKVTHVYTTAVLENGERPFFVMTKTQVEKIHQFAIQKNRGKDTPAWQKWWDQQALKTNLKRASKQLPSSSTDHRRSLSLAAELDSLAEARKLRFNQETEQFEAAEDRPKPAERTAEETEAIKREAAETAARLKREAEADQEPQNQPEDASANETNNNDM